MKQHFLGTLIVCLAFLTTGYSQNLAINADGSLPNANAILDVKSPNKGVLIPRMSTAARKAIPPTQGLLVYDTTTHSFWYHTGQQWQAIASSSAARAAAGDAWLLNGNTGTDSTHFLGTIDDVHLHIRVNDKPSGLIDQHYNNATWGYNTGKFLTTGINNTALGNLSLYNVTTGFANTATGFQSLYSNKEGIANTATGEAALYHNLTGYANAAVGAGALHDNKGGYSNTGMGHISLYRNTDGAKNTALGAAALYSNTTGSHNTASGYQALYSNTEGNDGAAFGFQALYSNTEGKGNTATGYQSLHQNTLGSFNTANGYKALATGSGNANTAVGYESLLNSNGHANTAVGYQTLLNNAMGEYNTAVGLQALNANTGSRNTAIGANALRVSALAIDNTAVGYDALKSNTTGSLNVGLGSNALNSNTTGESNTALGVAAAVLNTTGNQNTAIGFLTLTQNSTGSWNTASGHAALQTATGNGNTAMGMAALLNNNAGNYNTAIGYRANVPDQDVPIVNATAIGANAIVDASNKVRIGNAAVTVIEGQVPFTTPSDGRFKFKIQDDVKGLDFILQLKPVTYQFDVKRFDNQYEQKEGQVIPASNIIQASYDEAARIRRSGFIAQEVEKAANASGYNFSGIIKPRTEQDHYSLSYDAFVVPLVKAVQEQQKIIEKLQETNANEQSRISRLEKQVEELLRQLKASK